MNEPGQHYLLDCVVNAIIAETLSRLPGDIIEFYRDIPGRRPSENSLKIQETLSKLGDNESKVLIKDIVDSVLFSVFSLIDQEFKDLRIATSFSPADLHGSHAVSEALEIYRKHVDPGGHVVE